MKIFTILFSSLLLITATGCSQLSTIEEPEDTEEVELTEEEHMDDDMMMMEQAGELTAEEAARYQADLSLEERVELAHDLSLRMPLNGMEQLRVMFPDLEVTEDISDEDPRNMMKMGPEALLYSAEADFTVQICVEANTPMHIYNGANPSDADFEDAMNMMQAVVHDDDMGM